MSKLFSMAGAMSAALVTMCAPTPDCQAAFTFLGPTPYLSKADSPFPMDGSNPDFYLEDFEDGELNTPGILQPLNPAFGSAFWGHVMGPSEVTSSVDADDGVIDGSGTGGHSFQSGGYSSAPTSRSGMRSISNFSSIHRFSVTSRTLSDSSGLTVRLGSRLATGWL